MIVGFGGAILIFLERVIYIVLFSFLGLMISAIIGIFGEQFFTMGLVSAFFYMIDHSPDHEKEYYAYIAFKELPFGVGRIVGVIVFLVVLHFENDVTSAKLWYVFLGFLPLVLYYLTRRFEEAVTKRPILESS